MKSVNNVGNSNTITRDRQTGRRPALSETEELQLVHEYNGPAKPLAEDLASKYGVTRRTVFNILRRHRPPKKETPGLQSEGSSTSDEVQLNATEGSLAQASPDAEGKGKKETQ